MFPVPEASLPRDESVVTNQDQKSKKEKEKKKRRVGLGQNDMGSLHSYGESTVEEFSDSGSRRLQRDTLRYRGPCCPS